MSRKDIISLFLFVLAIVASSIAAARCLAEEDPIAIADPPPYPNAPGTWTNYNSKKNCYFYREGCDDPAWDKMKCYQIGSVCRKDAGGDVNCLGMQVYARRSIGVAGDPQVGGQAKGTTEQNSIACGWYYQYQSVKGGQGGVTCQEFSCLRLYYMTTSIPAWYCAPITQ